MDNNEIILQPEITGSVNVKIGKVTKMNLLCPEDDYSSSVNNVNAFSEKDKEFIQNLKCCGNCIYYDCQGLAFLTKGGWTTCLLTNETAIEPKWVCDNWVYDNLSFDKRNFIF